MPQLLPLRQAASLLSRSARTVRRLIAAGDLPAVRIRGRLYVKRDELRAFIERHVEIPPS
ncbi:helix-turn-helix domain-containing protein [Neoroseomonas rubea]|uniref:helix-turn-helix domain-containing protein n=1 Tax=Neoroseomonas rubea TaxID=2748666 RepID=UPI0018DFBA60